MFGQNDSQATNNPIPDGALQASLADPLPTGGSLGDTAAATDAPAFTLPPTQDIPGAVPSAPPVDASAPLVDNAPFTSPSSDSPSTSSSDSSLTNDDLLSMKQNALQQLSPLVSHLDQSPEEKFRTTMMMIQAADDQSLLKLAYDTAQQITDEKVKAQALLDVVNEINYFTQQHNK